MAKYFIRETPGKAIVYPDPDNSEHTPLKTQDEAKIEMAKLRAQARADGRQVDFVVERDMTASATSGNGSQGATSIRLSEEVRKRLAMFVGRIMVETGDMPSMGEAVVRLIDHFEATRSLVNPLTQELDETQVIEFAKALRRAQKAAADA